MFNLPFSHVYMKPPTRKMGPERWKHKKRTEKVATFKYADDVRGYIVRLARGQVERTDGLGEREKLNVN